MGSFYKSNRNKAKQFRPISVDANGSPNRPMQVIKDSFGNRIRFDGVLGTVSNNFHISVSKAKGSLPEGADQKIAARIRKNYLGLGGRNRQPRKIKKIARAHNYRDFVPTISLNLPMLLSFRNDIISGLFLNKHLNRLIVHPNEYETVRKINKYLKVTLQNREIDDIVVRDHHRIQGLKGMLNSRKIHFKPIADFHERKKRAFMAIRSGLAQRLAEGKISKEEVFDV